MSPRRSAAESRRTREKIIERSVAIGSVEGLEGLTIGRLATDLGMSKAGVLGHFGSKQALQLAALHGASDLFTRLVWEPVAELRPGLRRLRAFCEEWIRYLEHERTVFPGGCLFATASVEFDARGGPVHDAVARYLLRGRRLLVQDLRVAVRQGELPPETDPEQLAFEMQGLYMALNQELQLFAHALAPARTRRALDRMLGS
ncbi:MULTISPECIES: TetR/AcrR family transcriptional regulator [Streptomyces]|uniref:TetR family transcriptional regulator n=1 Tax=Streptomyces cacaoi TaxID=1898 RepID=A0A4Y3R6N4_STRCI|nr:MULTISPECIES: TetR/AcrR family transcriptional regulator [Streptomyces]NNG84727.1 TetR/AcrR family transcriptional regulator [Streptomyces cacaoi]QHF96304.1 TetR/AcrR family transcriptional regulator [Streptomyces sp. NHF165]GEB53252.1 TetR family transcriptional regulator [Streptomyces cacaoi]